MAASLTRSDDKQVHCERGEAWSLEPHDPHDARRLLSSSGLTKREAYARRREL